MDEVGEKQTRYADEDRSKNLVQFTAKISKRFEKGIHEMNTFKGMVEQKIMAGQNDFSTGENIDIASRYFLDIIKDEKRIAKILEVAEKIKSVAEVLVCIGVGGSYLGHKAILEIQEYDHCDRVEILYAGNSLSSRELERVFKEIGGRDFAINVISKSGKTLEVMEAFWFFREKLEEKYGKDETKRRIFVTTDAENGVLREIASEENYVSLPIPREVGGRFSVFTEVGLLPMAVAGIDIREILKVAAVDFFENTKAAREYAMIRNLLYDNGAKIEILASFEPSLKGLQAWWRQLFAESEGKNFRGVFPAIVSYSGDLHSMGQMIQQGERAMFETFIEIENDELDIDLGSNRMAFEATRIAHFDDGKNTGIPVLTVSIPDCSVYSVAKIMAFFMRACIYSGYIGGVNPYTQEGVEKYKEEMRKMTNSKG